MWRQTDRDDEHRTANENSSRQASGAMSHRPESGAGGR
jgi:hypothetical protein